MINVTETIMKNLTGIINTNLAERIGKLHYILSQ